MRISNILPTLLFALPAANAAIIPHSSSFLQSETTLSKREPSRGTMQGIRVWSTAEAGAGTVKMVILGGLRLTPVLCDIFTETCNGPALANAFYGNFIARINEVEIANMIPIYKSSGEDWGLLGLKIEAWAGIEDGSEQNVLNNILQHLTAYFNDNIRVPIHHEPVADAFNVGGPFVGAKLKRNNRHDGLLEKRDVCLSLDLISLFRPDAPWDPDSEMYGVTPCDVPDGTGKKV